MRVTPHLDTEEKKAQCLKEDCHGLSRIHSEQKCHDSSNEPQEQQEIAHLSTAAAIEHRRQIIGLHIQETYTELRLAREELKCRIADSSLDDDNYHALIEQEFDSIIRLFINCHKLVDCCNFRGHNSPSRTDKMPVIVDTSSAVDAAVSGADS